MLSLHLTPRQRAPFHGAFAFGMVLLAGCASQAPTTAEVPAGARNADDLMVIDCLLPGQVRKLGAGASYISQRRPIKTTASDCEIRGGEYVAFDRADYATALKIWLPMAQTGDKEAQTYVGEIYEKGLGIQPDYQAAAMFYEKAAAQGHSRAMINLGNLYEKGLGVTMDKVAALNWYRRASGITNDTIEYNSTFEVRAQAQQTEIESLKGQVSAQTAKVEQLEGRLAATQRQLKARKQSLLEAQKRQHEQQLALIAEESKAINQQSKEVIAQLRAELAAAREDVNAEQSELASLNQKADAQGKELAGLSGGTLLASADAPAIEIIDPPIALTRGMPTVRLRAGTQKKEIVGKIKAPAGLKSLSVNGKAQSVDDYSLFWVEVPVRGVRTPVKIEAVDGKGQTISFDLSLVAEEQSVEKSTRLVEAATLNTGGDTQLGNYYALVIGNNTYKFFPALETAVNDATETAKLLREQFGFSTTLITNAGRYQILSELNKLRETMTNKDNLLIYYAGHGELEEANDRGYWLPVDAEPGNTTNWISNVSISDLLNTIPAKHILVVADSCYAGKLSQASVPRVDVDMTPEAQAEWVRIMSKARARTAMTSGGVAPVIDNGGDGHSIFASAFLETLGKQAGVVDGYSVYREVLGKVRTRAKALKQQQIPEYAPLRYAGHEAGEFFFQARR
jgi:hypothetical protein